MGCGLPPRCARRTISHASSTRRTGGNTNVDKRQPGPAVLPLPSPDHQRGMRLARTSSTASLTMPVATSIAVHLTDVVGASPELIRGYMYVFSTKITRKPLPIARCNHLRQSELRRDLPIGCCRTRTRVDSSRSRHSGGVGPPANVQTDALPSPLGHGHAPRLHRLVQRRVQRPRPVRQ